VVRDDRFECSAALFRVPGYRPGVDVVDVERLEGGSGFPDGREELLDLFRDRGGVFHGGRSPVDEDVWLAAEPEVPLPCTGKGRDLPGDALYRPEDGGAVERLRAERAAARAGPGAPPGGLEFADHPGESWVFPDDARTEHAPGVLPPVVELSERLSSVEVVLECRCGRAREHCIEHGHRPLLGLPATAGRVPERDRTREQRDGSLEGGPDLVYLGERRRSPAEVLPRDGRACNHNNEGGFVHRGDRPRVLPDLVYRQVPDIELPLDQRTGEGPHGRGDKGGTPRQAGSSTYPSRMNAVFSFMGGPARGGAGPRRASPSLSGRRGCRPGRTRAARCSRPRGSVLRRRHGPRR